MMVRKLTLLGGVAAMICAAAVLPGQSTLPKKPIQPSEAKQPTTSTAPPLRAKPIPDKPPRLTDPATTEDGRDVGEREITAEDSPTVVLRRRNPDRVMAAWIALTARESIALAEIARERTQNADVKDLAGALITEQEMFMTRLKPLVPSATRPDYLGRIDPPRVVESAPVQRASDPADRRKSPAQVAAAAEAEAAAIARRDADVPAVASESRDFSVLQIERELAVQRLASSKKILAESRDVDQAFLGLQAALQKELRDQLLVYQRHVSTDLNQKFADETQAIDERIGKIFELMPKLSHPAIAAPEPRAK